MYSLVKLVLLLIVFKYVVTVKLRHSTGRHGFRFHGHGLTSSSLTAHPLSSSAGLWPSVFNVATKSSITSNATCGARGREEFCRLGPGDAASGPGPRGGRCGVCDAGSPDPSKRHPIENVLDGTGKWWQSPSLSQGREFEKVTITLDLKQLLTSEVRFALTLHDLNNS